jgi:hypothetical protein
MAKDKGIELEIVPIVKEAFVFFVNKQNPVENLTLSQIQNIYSGNIKNWKEVGGADNKIKAFQRPENSGSQSGMLELVMKGKKMMEPTTEIISQSMADIIDVISDYDNGANAIGYSYYYYASTMYSSDTMKLLSVNGIEPSYENDTPISVIVNNEQTKRNTIYNISDKYAPIRKCDVDFTPELICVDGYDTTAAKNILERFPKAISVLDATMPTAPVFELVRKVKYAICSREFAETITSERIDFQHPETLVSVYQKLKKKYIQTEFVITLGERGALYSINNQIKITPALKMDVKDTHGCGPIFRAAFAHTIVLGGDIEKATKIGCIAAGLATQEVGAVDSIPTLEDITNLYEQNYS